MIDLVLSRSLYQTIGSKLDLFSFRETAHITKVLPELVMQHFCFRKYFILSSGPTDIVPPCWFRFKDED